MRKLILIAAASLLALPSAAHGADQEGAADEALPTPGEIAGMGSALERMTDALLGLDVGPVLDAADPHRRRVDHGRPGRTLRGLGERDDPAFEQRLRANVRGTTAGIAGMVEAFRALTPMLRRSLDAVAVEVEDAMRLVPPPYEPDLPED
jgi:hypothetical protein